MPKVVRISEGNAKYVPGIRVAGKWLEEYGFKLGDSVVLTPGPGRIEITKVPGKPGEA